MGSAHRDGLQVQFHVLDLAVAPPTVLYPEWCHLAHRALHRVGNLAVEDYWLSGAELPMLPHQQISSLVESPVMSQPHGPGTVCRLSTADLTKVRFPHLWNKGSSTCPLL